MSYTYDQHLSKIEYIPYIKGRAEHASTVRKTFQKLKNENFVVAVDVPQGLEGDVLFAVNKLPKISLIIDEFYRAIPIIPTDAAMEAIRSAYEFGVAVEFIDITLAVPSSYSPNNKEINFSHLAEKIGPKKFSKILDLDSIMSNDQYTDARQRYMSFRLRELVNEYEKVLFVSGIQHCGNVLKYLKRDVEPPDDRFLASTVVCKVRENDVWRISPEVPYFMYLYEINREYAFNREEAIVKLYSEAGVNPHLMDAYRYARNLSLGDGQLYPDLNNLLVSAKYCVGEDYAYNVLSRAVSYPFADEESNCVILNYIDYDLRSIEGQNIFELELSENKHFSFNEFDNFRVKKRNSSLFSFTRQQKFLKMEKEFINHLSKKYHSHSISSEYKIEEFSCGLKNGIDVKSTSRYKFLDKLYVREGIKSNVATIVVDFGGEADNSVYFNTQNFLIGAAKIKNLENTGHGKHWKYCWSCFTAFLNMHPTKKEIENMLFEIDSSNPLLSCIDTAINHSKKGVFVFTNSNLDSIDEKILKSIKIFNLEKIPKKLLDEMRCFYAIED
ncbi:MAG: hypothetical protein ACOC5T_04755 [Elusimicrobiota bacterium]